MLKIFTFAPKDSTGVIIDAMAEAGAGTIGNYTHNAFVTHGTGNWKSGEGTHPAIGEVGKLSQEPEDKIEMVCPEDKLEAVIAALRKAHPYEEPAIDVFKQYDYQRS